MSMDIPEGFEVLPKVMIQKGVVVEKKAGKLRELHLDDEPARASEVISGLFEYLDSVYIMDMDGIDTGHPDFDLYKNEGSNGNIWVHSRFDHDDNIIDLLMNGAEFTVVGDTDIPDRAILDRALEVTSNIVYRMPVKNCSKDITKSLQKRVRDLLEMDVTHFLLLQRSSVFKDHGPCVEVCKRLRSLSADIRVYLMVGGGHFPFDGIRDLHRNGFSGVVTDLRDTVNVLDIEL